MAYGNRFKSAELSGTSTSEVYATEQYPFGSTYVQPSDEVPAVTIEGVVVSNSGVGTATANFALLRGDRVWIFIQASANIPAGACVMRSSNTNPYIGAENDADGMTSALLLGVADHAININQFGWVIARGCCVVESSAGVAAGHNLDTDGNTGNLGSVDTSAGDTASGNLGRALEAVGAVTAGFVQAYINVL